MMVDRAPMWYKVDAGRDNGTAPSTNAFHGGPMPAQRNTLCTFPGCTNRAHAKGLCRSHRKQQVKGIPLRPLGTSRVTVMGIIAHIELCDRSGRPCAVAIVDVEDVPKVSAYRWSRHGKGYAHNAQLGLIHRFFMEPEATIEVDHINGKRLDCRRENLRLVPRAKQQQNIVQPVSSAGYRGVHRCKSGRFAARVTFRGKYHHGGTFDTVEEAAKAAQSLRNKLFTHNNEARHPLPTNERAARGVLGKNEK